MRRYAALAGLLATTTLIAPAHAALRAAALNQNAIDAAPHIATNAVLATVANATYPNGVWRDHYATGGFADGPLFFTPQSGTCASKSWVNDGGNCVDSTSGDGNSWKALHQNNVLNVKEFGALGNNATDDSAAIQAAAAAAASATPGVFYDYVVFPSGNFCITSLTSVTAPRLTLVGYGNAIVKVCGAHDVGVFSLNGTQEVIRNLQIQGYNDPTATQATVSLGSSCIECRIEGGTTVQYGGVPISTAAGDAQILDTKALDGYGVAIAQATSGAFWRRDKFDQSWPTGTAPTAPFTLAAWQANHAYSANQAVSIGTNSWIIQETAANCTSSSGSEPAVAAYGTVINDGTCTWKLAQPYAYDALRIDTGAAPTFVSQLDATGTFTHAVGIGEDGGGGPQLTMLRDINGGGPLSAGVYAQKGQGLYIEGGSVTNCVLAGCKGIQITSTFGQDVHIGSGFEAYNNPIDVSLEGGTGNIVDGAILHGSSTECIDVAAGVGYFTIAHNNLSTGGTWGTCAKGIVVETGASDHYNVIGNMLPTSNGFTDGGTGTNKTVLGNN